MKRRPFPENLICSTDENKQLKAITKLSPYVGDNQVFDQLCAVVLVTLNAKVRNKAPKS